MPKVTKAMLSATLEAEAMGDAELRKVCAAAGLMMPTRSALGLICRDIDRARADFARFVLAHKEQPEVADAINAPQDMSGPGARVLAIRKSNRICAIIGAGRAALR